MEWLSRTKLLLGDEGIKKLSKANVLVVGLGGVGAYAAEMVCRAGIGSMTIVDGDDVHISNLNRQLLALNSNMGRPKAEVMAERLLDINPSLKIEVINEFLRDERTQEVLDKGFDYVVDAIDTLSPKVFLIYHAVQRHIPVVSSMGSGGKMDPEQVSIDDISKTTNCHLARMLRKRLHRLGITTGVKAVYSTEPVDKSRIVNVDDEQNKVSAVGTISYMPALFGMTCASVVIRDLLAKE